MKLMQKGEKRENVPDIAVPHYKKNGWHIVGEKAKPAPKPKAKK